MHGTNDEKKLISIENDHRQFHAPHRAIGAMNMPWRSRNEDEKINFLISIYVVLRMPIGDCIVPYLMDGWIQPDLDRFNIHIITSHHTKTINFILWPTANDGKFCNFRRTKNFTLHCLSDRIELNCEQSDAITFASGEEQLRMYQYTRRNAV